MVLGRDYKTSVGRSIFHFNLLQTFFNGTPSLWQYRLWSWYSSALSHLKDTILISFESGKGQIKSKAALACCRLSQTRTNEFVLFAVKRKKANKTNSFVRFLGESTARQSAFGLIWPLLFSQESFYFWISKLETPLQVLP